MEFFACVVLLLGVSFAPCSLGQGLVTGTTEGSTSLQPWLVGLAAVVGFLVVMFLGVLINRIFILKKLVTDCRLAKQRDIHPRANIYDNLAMDPEEGPSDSSTKVVEDEKVTSM
ncbi:small integral membrane protein 24 isoform X2 [Rhineura floridana]|uniref:small integral membrane protein 24 isoform X2 n=1 Tax=Rhineura floridana TaxID=261503 RepID=UPI002AC89083|nr:small integral membrane protein 24 isoform X2 [Rhineura floridana]